MVRRFCYEYPRAAITVDCVVFGFDGTALHLLLIERNIEPFRDRWALPGGFVAVNETLEQAAKRELSEEAGLLDVFLEQLATFDAIDRDPRERVISVAYFALVRSANRQLRAATDAKDVRWFPISKVPPVAFDHKHIIKTAHERLKAKVRYQPIGFELLPEKFSLHQLQLLYEAVLQVKLDKRNFRKKMLAMEILQELDEFEQGVSHRAAQLYRFDKRGYLRKKNNGFLFEI